jgi:RNA polymerase sigma factor (sigma-70 family)
MKTSMEARVTRGRDRGPGFAPPEEDREHREAAGRAARVPTDAPSFEAFFVDWHLPLYRALWLVTRNRHEAEEIMQDAFVRVWERWNRVRAMDRPEAYLFRTAMNVHRSRMRRALTALRRTIGVLPGDDAIANVEERDAIVRAMGRLTPAQRAAVVLVDLVGMSSAEAAAALGVRPPTVRVLAARGRALLRDEMGEER